MKVLRTIPILLLVLALLLAGCSTRQVGQRVDVVTTPVAGDTEFTNVVTTDLFVGDDATITSDLSVGDDAAITDDLAIGGWVGIAASTTISLTAGGIITPTGTYVPLTSAAAVTTSTSTAIANGTTAGDLLVLRNANASDAITIDGAGGNVECGANIALGANDVLTLFWNGSDWTCLALRDN